MQIPLEKLVQHFKLADPLEYMHVTQPYAANALSVYKNVLGQKGHSGLDLRARIGTPVLAAIGGTAGVATANNGGKSVRIYTDSVVIDGDSWRLDVLNYHLDEQLVQSGTRIIRGQLVAESGNTGSFSTGPHLHFGVRPQVMVGGKWKIADYNNGYRGYVDPKLFLTYEAMADKNLYNLAPHTLVKLEEGHGGAGWWNGERFYVDEEAKILFSWTVANRGETKGKTASFTQEAWDSYDQYNLKGEQL